MKYECDKLAVQLGTKEEAHALLLKKYYVLKQQLDDKVSPVSFVMFCKHSDSAYLLSFQYLCAEDISETMPWSQFKVKKI